ncbi:hypothetical protein [Thalassotalea euphylliae]|uniref:Uncharacterized protein n=1 Tax=Thalassotalea euphylliae TaxID=1655234 RepID=A0A3E0TYA6_9GAMM|nr:hypothetical protein [Thalassotalea euphylliae]REL29440.1 hypothetical protein DXX94_01155 [Thalassotalea euphylliae]
MERHPLISIYPEKDRAAVESWYDDWQEIRDRIFSLISNCNNSESGDYLPAQKELAKIIANELYPLNINFMRKASATYYEYLQERFPAI